MVLATSAVVAPLSLLSDDVVIRAGGLLIAVLGGVTAWALGWREVETVRQAGLRQAEVEQRVTADRLTRERQRHLQVLAALDRRNRWLGQQLQGAHDETSRLHEAIATLRNDNEALRVQLAMSRSMDAAEAEVVALPRRQPAPIGFDPEWSATTATRAG